MGTIIIIIVTVDSEGKLRLLAYCPTKLSAGILCLLILFYFIKMVIGKWGLK